jgi:hypothetical protein
MMNSFHAWMKAKIEVATRPGPTSGRSTRTKAPKRVVPSTIDASSRSLGTPSMNPRSVQIVNGKTKVRYVTITPLSLSTWLAFESTRKIGMISAVSGIICTAMIRTMNARRP